MIHNLVFSLFFQIVFVVCCASGKGSIPIPSYGDVIDRTEQSSSGSYPGFTIEETTPGEDSDPTERGGGSSDETEQDFEFFLEEDISKINQASFQPASPLTLSLDISSRDSFFHSDASCEDSDYSASTRKRSRKKSKRHRNGLLCGLCKSVDPDPGLPVEAIQRGNAWNNPEIFVRVIELYSSSSNGLQRFVYKLGKLIDQLRRQDKKNPLWIYYETNNFLQKGFIISALCQLQRDSTQIIEQPHKVNKWGYEVIIFDWAGVVPSAKDKKTSTLAVTGYIFTFDKAIMCLPEDVLFVEKKHENASSGRKALCPPGGYLAPGCGDFLANLAKEIAEEMSASLAEKIDLLSRYLNDTTVSIPTDIAFVSKESTCVGDLLQARVIVFDGGENTNGFGNGSGPLTLRTYFVFVDKDLVNTAKFFLRAKEDSVACDEVTGIISKIPFRQAFAQDVLRDIQYSEHAQRSLKAALSAWTGVFHRDRL